MSAATIKMPVFVAPWTEELTEASVEVRFELVDRLMKDHGRSLDEVPAANRESPLAAWFWFVLVHNGIEPAYDETGQRMPTSHYGIDLTFASREVNLWVFFLA